MRALTAEAFRSWMDAYGLASERNDPAASAALFTSDARYYESPFDKPIIGRAAIRRYWESGARRLTDKRSDYEILAVHDRLGIARWRSTFIVIESGERLALDCLFVVQFGEEGRCELFQEWWHSASLGAGTG
jgi:hypothetical protein